MAMSQGIQTDGSRHKPRRLALAAKVRRSTAQHDLLDRLAALEAGFSCAVIDAVKFLECAFQSVGVDEVADGRGSPCNATKIAISPRRSAR